MGSSASKSDSTTSVSVLDWTPEKLNGFKLRRLIIDGGTTTMRNVLQKCHPGKSIQKILTDEKHKLDPLRIGSKSKDKKVINQSQWDILYPNPPNMPDINNFDITLLSILLRNICGLTAPATGWDEMPNASDISDVANIIRIKLFRNKIHAHISETGVNTTDFEDYWKKISPVLISLGLDQSEIERLKNEECGEEVKERVMKAWNAMESYLQRIETRQQETREVVETSHKDVKECKRILIDMQEDRKKSDEVLKKLACCDFTSERNILCDKFVEGTREWVFKQVEDWFNDDSSENRAFIITGEAGMGKSMIAAKICERMNQHFAGCHFFSYKNDRYRDPKIFLQSLAFQICSVLQEYKVALADQLSYNNEYEKLNERTIEGLFSLLLKEPLVHVKAPGKNILFVIDGVDESCDSHARSDLVDLIATHLVKLPKFIRFLITTRPEKNIVGKFEPLNPFFLKKTDQNNVEDLRTFFKSKLSLGNASTDNFRELTWRSDGNMLYAFYLFEIFMEKNSLEDLNNLATGLTSVFEVYFRRLEKECTTVLGITEDAFLTLLSAMVASFEPLPLDFVVSIFSIKKDTPSAKRKAVLVMNCISLLFVIEKNRVSFFHKSVKDWLAHEKDHIYKIDENYGHFVLAKLCAECFDNVLKTTDLDQQKLTDVEVYALRNGFFHMIKDEANVVSHVYSYLHNFELICRCAISVDGLFWWVDFLRSITRNSQYRSKLKGFESIIEILRASWSTNDEDSNGILQYLILDAPKEISSKAMELHARFFPNRPYFENVSKHNENANKESIALFSREVEHSFAKESSELSLMAMKKTESCSKKNDLSSADVCNLFDYVVLCFESGEVILISIKPFKVMWRKIFLKEEISCSCIAFHPHYDIILPGRLDQILSLTDGSWQPGPFVCEKNYFFTECCFSPDNNILVTANYNDEHLILWDLVSGEKKRCIEVGGHVCSCSFSSNGSYLVILKIGETLDRVKGTLVEYSVFDVVNNYTNLFESTSSFKIDANKIPLTSYKSDTFFVLTFDCFTELCCNGEGMHKHFKTPFVLSKLFFPPTTKSHEIVDRSIASQVMPNVKDFRYYLFVSEVPLPRYLINLYDGLNLVISFQDTLTLEVNKFTPGNISFDGRYFYQHSQSLHQLRVLKRYGKVWIFQNEKVYQDVIAFAVVINGVFVVTAHSIVEMWNIEMTERLMHSQQMAAIECCESVSDYLIACVRKTEVSFINSRNLQVVSTTLMSENQLVLACSSKYDVLVKDIRFQNGECFIMRNNKRILSLPDAGIFQMARFSPDANKLVLYDANFDNGYRCYDISESSVTTVSESKQETLEILCFLDNEYFITIVACKQLYLNSIHSTNILPTIRLDQYPISVFYCHGTQTLIVNYMDNNFRELRVKWPRK